MFQPQCISKLSRYKFRRYIVLLSILKFYNTNIVYVHIMILYVYYWCVMCIKKESVRRGFYVSIRYEP